MLLGYTNRARVLTLKKDYDAALADFAAAQQIDPNARQIFSNRCITYTAMGKYDLAIADCNNVIEKLPKWQFSLVNRADAYMAKGSLDLALKDYNTVLKTQPEQCARPCRTRSVVREAARPGAGARRLSFGRLCADAL